MNKIIFDALLHTGKPDLMAMYGMPRLVQIGANSYAGWSDPAGMPTEAWYDNLVANQHPSSGWIFIDSEAWPVSTQADRLQTAQNFATVAQGVKSRNPAFKFGFYSFPLMRDFWRSTKFPGDSTYDQWQADNNDFSVVYPLVDAFFPSLYFFYDRPANGAWTVSGFRDYVNQNILEQKRLIRAYGNNQPIYPFVWWRHDPGGQLLDFDLWCEMLRRCYQQTDGLAVWGGWQEQWSDFSSSAWWREISARLESNRFW